MAHLRAVVVMVKNKNSCNSKCLYGRFDKICANQALNYYLQFVTLRGFGMTFLSTWYQP